MQKIEDLFEKIEPDTLRDNFIQAIGNEWMLITAGTPDHFNTMTASWGAIGVFWHKPVAICFIRPTRHTFGFASHNDVFTLSFFSDKEHDILNFCGTKSGRDTDKIAATGLIPLETENKSIGYAQSRLCVECRKIYYDDLKPGQFLMPGADKRIYPKKDYHRMFVGEILNCYKKR
jgi:flavin reductase (DIM6/NTAB) family NADH-FMN oxidoreductase RutF